MKDMTFEQTYEELQKLAERIKSADTTLEEAIECYEKGMIYYNKCKEILDEAKQKIETFEGEVM